MTRLEEMVIAAIPTARPGVDFSFETDENGHAILSHWDELKIVMCAVKRHLPEGMAIRVWQDAVDGYAKKYGVE